MTDYPFFSAAARNVIETHGLNADTFQKSMVETMLGYCQILKNIS
jgi:hypothetical protein